MNKKGFTLVELLAATVILGLVISIAVVSVSKYTEKSKRELYISTAKEYIAAAANGITQGKFVMRDPNVTYYIHYSNLKLERDRQSSPYGKWVDAYVAVVIDENNDYKYYWTSLDDKGNCVDVTLEKDLSENDIYFTKNKTINRKPIDGRTKIVYYDSNGDRIG